MVRKLNEPPKSVYTDHFNISMHMAIIGSAGSGKRALAQRFCDDTFYEYSNDGKILFYANTDVQDKKVQIKILAMQDYKKEYLGKLRGSQVIVIVFDITDYWSFANLDSLLLEARNNFPNATFFVVGTHADLTTKRVIDTNQFHEWADKHGSEIEAVTEVSSKTGNGVAKLLQDIAETFIRVIEQKKASNNNPLLIGSSHFSTNKKKLINSLQQYITRIDKGRMEPDFKSDFLFFKDSRALNRHANYLLAKALKDKLLANESISSVFSEENLLATRNELIQQQGLDKNPHFKNRGINSSQLKAIFALGQTEKGPTSLIKRILKL